MSQIRRSRVLVAMYDHLLIHLLANLDVCRLQEPQLPRQCKCECQVKQPILQYPSGLGCLFCTHHHT